jgi:hypothetical protein
MSGREGAVGNLVDKRLTSGSKADWRQRQRRIELAVALEELPKVNISLADYSA